MVGIVVWLLIELLTQEPTSLPTAVAILVLALLGAVFVLAAAIGSLRAASWIRGAAFVWQLIQIAIAVGCFQGVYAQPEVGWTLLVPSLLGIVLLLSPSVTRALRRA
ncbi:hypothetical protein CLV54_2612 [Compostimonas suwonensis]|uniref:Uncharacterized protein n=2 Tax=Compostimonas suwonensis TaxID=1048394 RepID=A0A2M9BUN8_9MICO|nr:hypothetical protein CLV54_2612 [Compostimonas suwonensis]